ncbi:MAG: gas vesicle protein [Chloroflexi bacterium]|nr:gas vesicle protein [Chloroflexota bacterium]
MVTGSEIAQRAKEQLARLTGLKPDTVSALSKAEEGWHVSVDLIELKRIPEATDVLATYEVVLDDAGNMIRYERTKRYYRGQVTEKEA